MRTAFVAVCLSLCALSLPAQRHKLEVNTETPEGQLLQQIGQESDEAKKKALLEEFVAKYSRHVSAGWVYAQLQPLCLKAGEYDKAIELGDKLLALDPEDSESAHGALKAAEARKDPDLILQYALKTSEAARKAVKSKKPEEADEDEEAAWKRKIEFATQVDKYAAYSIYTAALQASDPQKKIQLAEALRERFPDSEYNAQLEAPYFLALQQSGQADKAIQVAEASVARGADNEDMLLVLADHYYKQNNAAKVLEFSGKLVSLMKTKPAPQGVSAADWEKKRTLTVGVGLFLGGVTYGRQSKFADADKLLREALPLISNNKTLQAEALFHLGLANYKLGEASSNSKRIIDALRFSEQCAAIASPFQAQAAKNAKAIRSQYRFK